MAVPRCNTVTMMNALLSLCFVACASLLSSAFGCDVPPWTLKRADARNSVVSFFNNTITDSFMMVRWTWMDSSSGLWDTRLRVSLNKEDIIGGGFTYSDQYENEIASVRWFRKNGPIKWKFTSFSTPPDSWWMTSTLPWGGNMTWGYKNQITDGSWVFKVDNDTFIPKNEQNFDGWPQTIGNRWKRTISLNDLPIKNKEYNADFKNIKEEERDKDVAKMVADYFKVFYQAFRSKGSSLDIGSQLSNDEFNK
ncbi:uncharacterized protein LOC126902534 isoform X2 [Daktulosphaira vitifoliae]|uniref:uncharacterized protein LOC126902534 isoform X2 n=1 Tax=Daktulosphaira vitifoliae TaxID=58002 RepID=UPI0021AA47A9|nr:uncharacterized protein LOC126902534 isoform X2 [Daktulosphaira vitifoliae]